MRRSTTVLLALLLAACGQSGDLYLPAEPPAQPDAAAPATAEPAPAPDDEKKKKE